MTKKFIPLFIVATMLLAPGNAQAQLGRLLKEKAKKSLVKKLKCESESEKDDIDSKTKGKAELQDTSKKKKTNRNNIGNKHLMSLLGMGDVPYEDSYHFSSYMKTQIIGTDSTGEPQIDALYSFYFNNKNKNFSMEFETIDKETQQPQKTTMIFDLSNNTMLILGEKENERSGVAMLLPPDSSRTTGKTDSNDEPSKEELAQINSYYKATGRTKKILGYTCKEYIHKDPENTYTIWTTREISYDYSPAYGHLFGLQVMTKENTTTYMLGTILEMHILANNSQARTDYYVREFKPNTPKSIETSRYQIVGMNAWQTEE